MQAAVRSTTRAAKRLDLSGIMPPITTPFGRNGAVAFDKLADNLRAFEKIPFKGYVVQGSNGEYPMMAWKERVEMVHHVRQLVSKEKLVIGGSSCQSTLETIKLTNEMADVGADAVLVIAPSYFKSSMTTVAIKKFFEELADNSKISVILYNMPANTGMDLGTSLIAELAEHPNIIGIKDSGGDITKIARMVYETRDHGFQVLAGSTGFLLPSLLVGAVGGVNGLANILGNEVCKIYKLAKEEKYREAAELHLKLIIPNAVVTRELGVPAMKAAMDLFGYYGGPCRGPLLNLTESEITKVRNAFIKSGYKPPQTI